VKNIILRVAFLSTATIRKEQRTVNRCGEENYWQQKEGMIPEVTKKLLMVEAMVVGAL